jgi:hypothetical protein
MVTIFPASSESEPAPRMVHNPLGISSDIGSRKLALNGAPG